MKVLFVSDYLLAPFGGAQNSALAHLKSIKNIADEVDVVALDFGFDYDVECKIKIKRVEKKLDVLKCFISGNPVVVSEEFNKAVYDILDANNYDILFLDNSWFGKIALYCKNKYPFIKIITNFHGIKANSRLQNLKSKPYNPFLLFDFITAYVNERKVVKASDCCLVLNKRESQALSSFYGKCDIQYLPVYFIDTAIIEKKEKDECFNILFVGGALPANIKGIKWFITNVLPELDENVRLIVVGNTMERLNENANLDKRVNAVGRVERLDNYYNDANVVIGPIFEGDGMKTKTAEAMMYGKIFLGTDEALCGYECLDEYRCNSKQEFVDAINNLIKADLPKYSDEMRSLYNKLYSMEMADSVLKKIMISY